MRIKLDDVLHLFDNVKKVSKGYLVSCIHPNHGSDKNPSLHLRQEGDKFLLHCFKGCDTFDIFNILNGGEAKNKILSPQALRKILNPEPEDAVVDSKWQAIYDYRDKDNKLLYQEIRILDTYQSGKQKKRCTFRRTATLEENKEFGIDYVYSLEGIERVPYNLPNILGSNRWCCLVEGPKCAQYLIDNGFISSTLGASSIKWNERLASHFAGLNVILLPDNDMPGYKHMLDAAKNLQPLVNELKLCLLPGYEKIGDDVYDFFNSYAGTKVEFKGYCEKAITIKTMSERELEEILTFPKTDQFPQTENNVIQERIPLIGENSTEYVDKFNAEFPNNGKIVISEEAFAEYNQAVSEENKVFNDFIIGLDLETDKCQNMNVGLCETCLGTGYSIKDGKVEIQGDKEDFRLARCTQVGCCFYRPEARIITSESREEDILIDF